MTEWGVFIYPDVDKMQIIEMLSKERAVERMIENIAHQPMTANLKDLSQMVYVILLDYDEEKLVDLWEHDEIQFFLARIILNQYRSSTSTFHYQIRQFAQKTTDLTGRDFDEQGD